MAVPTVASSSVGTAESTASPSIAIPAWDVGDLVVLTIHTFIRTVSTAPTGWTALNSPVSGGSVNTYVYWKILASGEPSSTVSFTLSASNPNSRIALIRVTGHNATPINQSTSGSSTSPIATSSVTTTVDDCLILRILASDDAPAWTATSGDTGTEIYTSGNLSRLAAWKSSKATAGATGTATYTSNYTSHFWVIAIAPTAGGGSSFAPYLHQPQTWQFVGRK
jgi:hypothetical protein